jgi:hypothetical protein
MGKCTSKPSKLKFGVDLVHPRMNPRLSLNESESKSLTFVSNIKLDDISKALIRRALAQNYLFRGLSTKELNYILKYLRLCVAEDNVIIFDQGERGSLFYIINSGRVKVILNGKKVDTLSKEMCFGELALLSDSFKP